MNSSLQIYIFLKMFAAGLVFYFIYALIKFLTKKLGAVASVAIDFVLFFLLGLYVFLINLSQNYGEIAFFGIVAIIIAWLIANFIAKPLVKFLFNPIMHNFEKKK